MRVTLFTIQLLLPLFQRLKSLFSILSQHVLIIMLLILQFNFCAPPIRPDFPPNLGNDNNISTEGTVELGKKFIMYIEASSRNPLTYTWYKDDISLSNAGKDSFIIESLMSKHEGEYTCKVTASTASVVSNPYILQIEKGIQEVLLENNAMVFSSGKPLLKKPFVLYIKPVNTFPLTYQWYKNFEKIEQANNDTLLFWEVSNTDRGSYYCEVTYNSRIERSLFFDLEIGNNPPVWTHDTMQVKINAGAQLQLSLKDSCNDMDNDTLSFTLMPGLPDNDLINNGMYTFKSNPGDEREFIISIKASDGKVASIGTIHLIINQANKPPEFKDRFPNDSYQLNEGDNLTIQFETIDENNDEVTYKIIENTLPRPESLVIDMQSKTLSWTSNQGDKGRYKIIIEASDGMSTVKKEVDIGIGNVNLPPRIFISEVNQNDTVFVSEQGTLQFTAKLFDPNKEDKPTFTTPENMPGGAEFDNSSGVFTYTPAYDVSTEHLEKVFDNVTFHATDNAVENPLRATFVVHVTVRDKKFLITAESSTGGSIDPSGIIKAEPGKNYTFSITPQKNWNIEEVLVNDKNKGAVNTYTFENIQQDNSIKALFKKIRYTISISSDEYGKVNPEGEFHVALDTSIIITVNSNSGYGFEKWEILKGNPEINNISADTFKVSIKNESTAIKALFLEKVTIKCIAAGSYYSHFITSDNTLWATGDNQYGQLGDGTTTNRLSPVKVFEEADSVICGEYSTFVIRNDKTIWTTGNNQYGQLGLGDTLNRTSFTQILDMKNVKAISSGGYHTMIIKADGTLCGTGSNWAYSLGLHDRDRKIRRFTEIPDIPAMTKVCTGDRHTIALQSVNKLWGVGSNNYGQLGLGGDENKDCQQFIEVPGVSDIMKITAGSSSTFIIKNDNYLWAAGYNYKGNLGDGTFAHRNLFVKIMGSVTTVSSGASHTFILKNDNSLWAVGNKQYGKFGNGSTETTHTATPVKVLDNVKDVKTGFNHSIVLKNDNTVWGAGANTHGQLGLGDKNYRIFFRIITFK